MKNVFTRMWKSNYNNIFDNILYKYKNILNNSKLLKKIFIKKRKYYNKLKNVYIYIVEKKLKKLFLWQGTEGGRKEWEESEE